MPKLRKYPFENVNTYLPANLQMEYICDLQRHELFSNAELRIAIYINHIKIIYVYIDYDGPLRITNYINELVINTRLILYLVEFLDIRITKSIDIRHISNVLTYIDTPECITKCLSKYVELYLPNSDRFSLRRKYKIQSVLNNLLPHMDNDVV